MSDIGLFQRANKANGFKKKFEDDDDIINDELDDNFFSLPDSQVKLGHHSTQDQQSHNNPNKQPVIEFQPLSNHQQRHAYSNPTFESDSGEQNGNTRKNQRSSGFSNQIEPLPSSSSLSSSDEDITKLSFNKLTTASQKKTSSDKKNQSMASPSPGITSIDTTVIHASPTTVTSSTVTAMDPNKQSHRVKFNNHVYKLELEQRYSHRLNHVIYEDSEEDGIASPYSVVSTTSSLGEISQNEIEPQRPRIKTFSGVVDVFKRKASDNVRCQSMSSTKKPVFRFGKSRT